MLDAPLTFSGLGDQVIPIEPPLSDPRIATIAYYGASNFVVKTVDPSGADNDLLVNTIGNYSGTVPVNFNGRDETGFLEVQAEGNWTITLADVRSAPEAPTEAGGRYDGVGDGVVVFRATGPTRLAISCPGCQGNFAVHSYGDSTDLLVNEIGAYNGTVLVSGDTLMISVSSTSTSGPAPAWSLAVE